MRARSTCGCVTSASARALKWCWARSRLAAEHQAIYVLQGHARVMLAEAPAVDCPPGTIVRLPPGLDHHVLSLGPGPLKLLMVYSPPLPERNDTPLKGKPGSAT